MKQLWAPWRMAYVGAEPADEDGCFLCAAIAGADDESSLVVDRSPLTITLLNRFPYSSGHVMVVPTRHVHDPRELDPAEGSALFAGLQCALAAIDRELHPDGFNTGLNLGTAAGSSVEHMHLHVVPRWAGDTNFMPVLGDVKVLPELLDTTAKRLRHAFRSL